MLGYPAAPVQVMQVVHRKPVAQMELIVLKPFGVFLNGHARFPVFHRVVNKQALSHGSCQGIEHQNFRSGYFSRKAAAPFKQE